MSIYRETAISARRNYCITVATQPMYDPAGKTVQTGPAKAHTLITGWILSHVKAGDPFLAGIITEGTAIRVAVSPVGPSARKETVIRFGGVVPPQYETHITETEVHELLNELASVLGEAFNQQYVYVDYLDSSWVLESEQAESDGTVL